MILNSGVAFDYRSVEFRLSEIHIARKLEYRRNYDARLIRTLLGVFFSVATGKLTDESRDRTLKSAEEAIETLHAMLAPFGNEHASIKEERAKENDRVGKLADTAAAMGKLGSFKSVDQLRAVMDAMNQSITQSQ